MQKLAQAELARLRSLTPEQLENRVKWSIALALVVGFACRGAQGVTWACIFLCFVGFFLQYVKRLAPPEATVHSITKTHFSFNSFFLSAVAGSMVFLFFKEGIDGCMRDMALWALMFCLVSSVVKFNSREWRWITIGALTVSAGYIGTILRNIIFQTPMFSNPTGMQAAVLTMFNTYALSALALVTLVLVGVGRLSRPWSMRRETAIAESNVSLMQKLACFLRRSVKQCVAELPVYAFLAWYAGVVYFLSFPQGSVGEMFANQFLTSARDANIYPYNEKHVYSRHSRLLASAEASGGNSPPVFVHQYELGKVPAPAVSSDPFADGVDNPPPPSTEAAIEDSDDSSLVLTPDANESGLSPTVMAPGISANSSEIEADRESRITTLIIKGVVALGLFALPFSLIMRGAAFYAALMRRLMGATGKLRISESTLAAVRDTGDKLRLKYESRFLAHAARTFWWLLFWYAVVFSLVAFTGGGLGTAIRNWLDFSIVDSGLRHVSTEYNLNMRYFMAAVLAMYACGPLAVTGCVFLPHRSGRKIVVNEDGISAPDGPYASMWLRTFRLYVDIKSVTLKGKGLPDIEYGKDKRRIKIRFRTGGSLSFRVMDMPPEDLRLLLERIDEHAEDCELTEDIVALRVKLSKESEAKSTTDSNSKRGKFKSSIFVPFVGGERIENHQLRIVKVLANKPLSAVYLVRLANGKLAVLKQLVMPKDDETSREHLRIFQRECELMRELKHEGIARVIDAFNEGNNHFLLLEHFKGQDLKTVVDTYGARNIEDVANWALSLCDVLEHLHAKDIIHRDVTPENIVVGEHDGVRLIDFGAAHQFIEGITGTLIGKQSYVAPEQLRGRASKRSDIYSLGVTMNFLLTAREPVALQQCEPELGSGRSAQLMRNLIMAMTDFEEERRPESIQSVRQILMAVLDKEYVATSARTAPSALEIAAEAETETETETESSPAPAPAQVPANAPADVGEAELAGRTIQLMAEALPEQTLKVKTGQKKKVKVRQKADSEKH